MGDRHCALPRTGRSGDNRIISFGVIIKWATSLLNDIIRPLEACAKITPKCAIATLSESFEAHTP
jgi:hypothetical protein